MLKTAWENIDVFQQLGYFNIRFESLVELNAIPNTA